MNSTARIIFRFVDLASILVALGISSSLMLPPDLEIFADYTGASTFTVIILLLSFYTLDCYNVGREDFRDSCLRVLIAVFIGIVAAGFTFYTFEHWRFPRMMFVLQMIVNLALSLAWRRAYFLLGRRWGAPGNRVIFLGSAGAERAVRVLSEYEPETSILGYVGETPAPKQAGPCLGPSGEIFSLIAKMRPTRVIVLEAAFPDKELAHGLFLAKLKGLKVVDMRGLYERLAARVPVDLIRDEWLLLEDGFNLNVNDAMRRFKRALDIFFSLGLFVFALPLMLAAALCVRLESPGPVLYRQKRVGLNGSEFTVVKIRSMRADAEKDGAVWAGRNDSRVTRIGRLIRKTRIDELPQLVNVIKGEMSLIGPRPERMEFVRELRAAIPYYDVRHTVKPGISGWAQVCYPYGASLEDARLKLEYDLYYIKNMSALLDAKIILKTIGVVLFPKGAR
ncbi:MAG: TIGR03013 family PEP-CTERM/XrtA system glycosyltransferase [Desulfovibrio sp.]|jgi:sugar transferase (PEP-CTERM system associated)|nr:TIGR03013 family PEP-CTERM/XrtA system glycosyltransferase [Desulfovibrio sp.]